MSNTTVLIKAAETLRASKWARSSSAVATGRGQCAWTACRFKGRARVGESLSDAVDAIIDAIGIVDPEYVPGNEHMDGVGPVKDGMSFIFHWNDSRAESKKQVVSVLLVAAGIAAQREAAVLDSEAA